MYPTIPLDEVGTRLWQLLSETGEIEQVVRQMRTEYQVDEPRLRQELANLLEPMANAGVITRAGA